MTRKTNRFCIKYSYIPLILLIGGIILHSIFKIDELKYIIIPSGFLFFIMFYILGVFALYLTNYKNWYDQYDGFIIGWGVKDPFVLMSYLIIVDLGKDSEKSVNSTHG